MKAMLDLFSGLGGWSEAMMNRNDWIVHRFDNNPALEIVPNTTIADLNQMVEGHDWVGFDLITASPPCLDFSNAYSAPRPTARREEREFTPDMTCVVTAVSIIENARTHNPKLNWVIENVYGAIPDFAPILGPPRQIVGPFALWGNFPLLHLPRAWSHSKAEGDTWSTDPLRANRRAMIPLEVSEALRAAHSAQTTIGQW